MAFQTNVFRGGEWVTETVDLQTFLKSQAASKGPAKEPLLKPPRCGLLTRTVVESPVINSILPVRLRSPQNNDVAFVGDHYIQICELCKDGRLKEIARKNDFRSRIRNACVVGSAVIPELKRGAGNPETSSLGVIKTEDGEPGLLDLPSQSPPVSSNKLPPQSLMVVLEGGDSVFLFIRPGPQGEPEFVASRFENPRLSRAGPLGFNLAIDPSSRYMVLSPAADYFVIYELESHQRLNHAYASNEPLNPVISFRVRSVQGVVHKVAFLHPRPGDDHHIILLLVIVKNRKSRMVVYDWMLGDDLRSVFAEEKRGHRMPAENQMLLLLIPLTIESAFIAISPQQAAVCTECLHGPPKFAAIPVDTLPPTEQHRGLGPPAWTSWARPFRVKDYRMNRDCIYLAREDGVVLFVELDPDCTIDRSTLMDRFPCSISSAFGCLVACLSDQCSDVLMLGSDSGPGGFWNIAALQRPEKLGVLPNWSSVVDFATTDEFSAWRQEVQEEKNMVPWQQSKPRRPDRIFATCQGGVKGSITEYRYGLRANIGLDIEYGAGMKRAWLLSSHNPSLAHGYLLLLSMPDSSTILHLSPDFSSANEPDADTIPYDLSSTTLAVACSERLSVQITEQNVVLVAQDQSARFSRQELQNLAKASVPDARILDGCILGEWIAVSAHMEALFQIQIFKADASNLTLAHIQTIDVGGEVTCLSLGNDLTILAGIRTESQTFLGRASLRQGGDRLQMINLTEYFSGMEGSLGHAAPALAESIASIVSVRDTILLGSRSGEVIAVREAAGALSISCERFGMATASLSCSYGAGATDPTILVCCDNSLVSVAVDQRGSRRDVVPLKTKCRVWPVDVSRPDAMPPPVHFATAVDMPSEDGITPILMISGSRLLLAELQQKPGPVHRSIPVDGVPNRVIYSKSLQCLIVAVVRNNKPTLLFMNPDTGEDIGVPTDKNGATVEYILGLGKEKDRITGLAEWKYRRDGNVWNFLLVSTKGGRFMVVSTQKGAPRGGGLLSIRYWTRFKEDVAAKPIYSIAGYEQGLVYCAGDTIRWEMLDVEQRTFTVYKTLRLNSPATSLRISNGKLVALTSSESLVVIDYAEGNTENARLCHEDPWRRKGIHFIEVAGPQPDEPRGGIFLVADRECGIGALWAPWQTPEKEFEVVMEAELAAPIRRFRRGRTRPLWEQRQGSPKYGRLVATVDDAEILGVSLNGALHHFTLLSIDAWQLLRFIQNIALASGELFPYRRLRRHRPMDDVEPRMDGGLEMQVDGDILQQCLEKRALEQLMARPEHMSRFMVLLQQLDEGRHTAGLAPEDYAGHFQLAYDILEYYLLPVL